jgi:hypothetical protein
MSVTPTEFKRFLADQYRVPAQLQDRAADAVWLHPIAGNSTSESLMARSGLVVERRLHNSVFSGFTQNEIDSIVKWWKRGAQILWCAEYDVGGYNRIGTSNYEKLFGKRGLRSDAGYEARAGFVGETIHAMTSALDQPWFIEKDNALRALAGSSGTGSYALKLGALTNLAELGFLIHEWAHNAGMEDVCSACSSALFEKAASLSRMAVRSQARMARERNRHDLYPHSLRGTPPQCANNAAHGGPDGSQFQGYERATRLARVSKHLSVWNADSYRWYCLLFFKYEANAAFQMRFGRTPAW